MYLSSLVSFTDITTTPKFRSLAQSSLLSSLQLYFSVQKVSQNQCFNTALLLFPRTRSYLLYLPSQQIAIAPFQLLRPRTTESSLMLSLTQSSLSANPFAMFSENGWDLTASCHCHCHPLGPVHCPPLHYCKRLSWSEFAHLQPIPHTAAKVNS